MRRPASTPPPRLPSGALWRVAATLDEVRLAGPITDPAGRRGVGITITSGGERAEIVFSAETGMLLSDWIYKVGPVTTCDRDLDPCRRAVSRSDRILAKAGSVAMGHTILSAEVVPID